VDDIAMNIIRGDEQVKKAIHIRKSSRKKLWIITAIILILLIVVGLVLYFQFANKK
jgi:t-SNARE complex subunit (syntaxin)